MTASTDQEQRKYTDFYLFIGDNEKLVFTAKGILNDTINGNLVLTDNKMFFYFVSNISRDKIFIASHPYIASVELKEGFASSTLIINNKKETFEIKKINKKEAREFYKILNKIVLENKSADSKS
ncbi:MAG: PH domain-containing protein [Actinobacteria bacterium]|nr:PH domain-containing protein [Actinomycetota bacterium]